MPQTSQATQYLEELGFLLYSPKIINAMDAAHTHPDVEFNYIEDESITYLFGGVHHTVPAGHLTIFWAGIPHQTLHGSSSDRGVWGYIPLTWLLQWNLPNHFTSRLLRGRLLEFPLSKDTVRNWLTEHESESTEMRKLLELELRTAFTRLALMLPPRDQDPPTLRSKLEGGELHVSRITSYLAQHYAEEITIDDIARDVSLNRSYMMHLFRDKCKMSIWDYLTRLRISHAQRLLTTTTHKVLDIALECGFGSVAPFYVAFTRYVGCRPIEFRKNHQNMKQPEDIGQVG